jgi:hypothetical protein
MRRQRYNSRSTFETSGCNTCNIRLKVDETHETCIWSTSCTATPDLLLKHPNKTLATYIRKQLKHSNMCTKHLKKNTWKHFICVKTYVTIRLDEQVTWFTYTTRRVESSKVPGHIFHDRTHQVIIDRTRRGVRLL